MTMRKAINYTQMPVWLYKDLNKFTKRSFYKLNGQSVKTLDELVTIMYDIYLTQGIPGLVKFYTFETNKYEITKKVPILNKKQQHRWRIDYKDTPLRVFALLWYIYCGHGRQVSHSLYYD